ncbi:MAG: hypothetical protein CMN77_06905 [Spirochaetaceae bacterium]|nr:hypothetical protein [Spirochaetaceae bacterium]|tara:strand:- start:10143 stop:11834 length:1692 start_codon:yes stop_codon:yes gene_type:complete
MSIRNLLRLSFGLVSLLLVGGTLFSLGALYSVRTDIENIFEVRLQSLGFLLEADRDAYQSNLASLQGIMNGVDTVPAIEENRDQVSQRFNKFLKIWNESSGAHPATGQFKAHFPAWERSTNQIVYALRDGDDERARRIYNGVYQAEFSDMRNAMDELTQASNEYAKEEYLSSLAALEILVITLGSILCITIIALLLTYRMLMKGITGPLDHAVAVTDSLADGDLTVNAGNPGKNEFGQMIKSQSKMLTRLNEILRSVQDGSSALASTAEEMASGSSQFSETAQSTAGATEEISATSEELSAGMDNVAELASHQTSGTNALVSEMEELDSEIKSMNEVLTSNRELLISMGRSGQSGQSSLKRMNESMKRIQDSSTQVIRIVEVITGISEQVNLLSLNAAIEAARAGEAGRGFAVVADQVANLAEKTGNSIKEITSLLQQSDAEVQTGIKEVSEATTVVSGILEGVQHIEEMVMKFDQLMSSQMDSGVRVKASATDLQEQAREILNAMDQQRSAINEIVSSVSHIAESASTVSTGAEEIARGSQEVARLADELNQGASYFKIHKN